MADDFQYIKLPDGSYGKFRSDANDDVIRTAISKDFPDAFKEQKEPEQTFADKHPTIAKVGEYANALSAVPNEVFTGAAKGAGSTGYNLADLTNKGIRAFLPRQFADKYVPAFPTEKPDMLQPNGIAQKAGYFGEQGAEFAIPAGEAGKVGKAASAAFGPSLVGRAGALATRMGLQGLAAGTVNKAQGRDFTTGAALGAGAEAVATGVGAVANAIPSTERAGRAFQEVQGAAGKVPVDVSNPGNIALDIHKSAGNGGSMPQVIRKFLNRVSDPSQPPLTYEDARQFYQNASRLSSAEQTRLTPALRRQVAMFAKALGESIEDAAASVGKQEAYSSAMSEYRNAMKLKGAVSTLGDAAKSEVAKHVIGGAIAYKLLK